MTVRQVESPSRIEALTGDQATPRLDTLLLAVIAGCSLSAVRIETAWHRGATAAWIVGELVVMLGLWMAVRRYAEVRHRAEAYLPLCLLGAVSVPIGFTFLWRALGYNAIPNEILMLLCVQVAAMVLAMVSQRRRWSGLSVTLSAALLLFSMTMSTQPVVFFVAGLYGVVGLWWLMVVYWERLQVAFVPSHVEQCVPVRSAVVGVSALVVLVLAGFVGSVGASTYVLKGFLPTSGGDQWNDPNARSGVGDGDAMVAAKDNALSFGPVESDLFLESDMPSLYDTFNEAYGRPTKLKQQKAIALQTEERQQSDQTISQTQRSGREFSAARQRKPTQRKPLADRNSPALLYVVGKTPLHLGLEAYDRFDGRIWTHTAKWQEASAPEVQTRFGKPWIVVRPRSSRIHRGTSCYGLKIINLKTARVPHPPQLNEVHVDRVDRADFFDWTRDGMLEMPGQEFIPQLTVIHMHSRQVNLDSLRINFDFTREFSDEQQIMLNPYREVSGKHRATAEAWTSGIPRGWLQVEAVVERLRHRFQHDPQATAPDDCGDVVAHFLECRRGPDYLFASAAAELLRSLGYPVRVVSGFYADPRRFDHRAGQTTVLSEDVHVWAEVCVDGRNWVTIEPTPGYHAPGEHRTLRQWAAACFWYSVRWCQRHMIWLLCGAFGLVLIVCLRRTWLDHVGWMVCMACGWQSPEARLAWTIRLLEWRAWLVGRPRAPQKTVAKWYRPLVQAAPDSQRASLNRFFQCTDRLFYSRRGIASSNAGEIRQVCAAVVSTCERNFISRSFSNSSR